MVAELAVYRPGLGTVVRCRTCDTVLMVFVPLHGTTCTDLMGLASLTSWFVPTLDQSRRARRSRRA